MKADLKLEIVSDEYEVECNHKRWEPNPLHPKNLQRFCETSFDCPNCKGTGNHIVKLVGVVDKVEPESEYDSNDVTYRLQVYQHEPYRRGIYIEGDLETIVLEVVKQYRDNTLPDEIRNQLKEVPA